jgi:hypothetical protein
MHYSPEVKARAYELDPECWESYSGKPIKFKRSMEVRRVSSLLKADKEITAEMIKRGNIKLNEVEGQPRFVMTGDRLWDNEEQIFWVREDA